MERHTSGSWYHIPDLALRDHFFRVPLDYGCEKGEVVEITIFAREVAALGKEEEKMACLLFLQGGPGFECQRPCESSGWMKKAVDDYHVVLMDQRGTGLSTPLSISALNQFSSPLQQASYLVHFRADSIVKDAEHVRGFLSPNGDPWTVLGQSYGGFCAVTYLSFAPAGLCNVLLTGGLPPLDAGCTAELVYRACYKRVILQNQKFYQCYPQDVKVVQQVVHHLTQTSVVLPMGGRLSPMGLQLLGLVGLGSSGGFERLHFLFERAWDYSLVFSTKKQLSHTFLRMYENWLNFDTNPLYALLHESIYCQGEASNWAAHRVRKEFEDQFDPIKSLKSGEPIMFTGEMMFPWMFDEIVGLQPLKEAANLIAIKNDWPKLYDMKSLSTNMVPVAAVLYREDMYVNFEISEMAVSRIKGVRLWVTNEYTHSGIRESGARILEQLLEMVKEKREASCKTVCE